MGDWSDQQTAQEEETAEGGVRPIDDLQRRRARRGLAASGAWVASALWLPFAWLAFVDCPSNGRGFWLVRWPILPGFFAGLPFHRNEAAMFAAMGLATAVAFTFLTWLGGPGGRRRVAAVVLALLASSPASLASYAVFHSATR